MLINSQKANQAKKKKTDVEFDSILEKILNPDIQTKANKARSMKSVIKSKKAKKRASIETLELCLYCLKLGHPKEKY